MTGTVNTFEVEFVEGLANQPVSLTVDTSNLVTTASTINITQTQAGIADTPISPATNVISFGPSIQSGSFTLQHPDFLYALDIGDTVNISINSVALNLNSTTTGVSGVDGIQAVYRIYVANGPPDSNYLLLSYQNNDSMALSIKWDNTDSLFFGSEYSNAQQALDAHFGSGVWTINGRPMDMVLEFFGPATTFGSSPWTIYQDGWQGTGHPVTDRFDDGFDGIPQQYTLTAGGIPSSGNLNLHYGPYQFIIPYTGLNVNLNGHIHSTLADAVAAIDLSYGDFGPWVVRGTPALGNYWDGNLVFYGRQQSTGSNPWSINSNSWDVSVDEVWTEGTAPSAGTQAQHSFYIEGAFGGRFTLNGLPIDWNVSRENLLTAWDANVAPLHDISGYGTVSQPWIITYLNKQPQDLPTIDVTTLVGFTDTYLASAINCNSFFTIDGVNPYTLTSIPNGSGQTAIITTNIDMVASMSINQPATQTAGSAGTGGQQANFTITTDIVPSSSFIQIMYTGIIFDIKINANNTDENGDSIQTRLNNIGLGGWTYSGSPASRSMVFTRNAQQSYGSNAWAITDDNWGGVQINSLFTDGAYPTGLATAIQTWVAPAYQGVTGGTFTVTGDAETVGPCAWNISLGDLSTAWTTATGHSLSFSTGFGTTMAPYQFHFSEDLAITLPTIDGTLLTTDGTISNDFTDGSTTEGQNEIQTVNLADSPTGGTWAISYNNDDTVNPLNYNIAQQDLQAALRSNWGVSTINVSKSEFGYTVDFGVHAAQFGTNTIQADGSGLTKGVTASIVEIQKGQTLS